MRRTTRAVVLVITVLLLASCAAGANPQAAPGSDAGFWLGLWHGLILPITFVVSLFDGTVGVYEVANDGHWYDLGFVLGAGGLGLPGLLARSRRRRGR